MLTRNPTFEQKLRLLLRDFGCVYRDGYVYQLAIPGFASENQFHAKYRSLFAACEGMIPIIHDDHYYSRLTKLTSPRD